MANCCHGQAVSLTPHAISNAMPWRAVPVLLFSRRCEPVCHGEFAHRTPVLVEHGVATATVVAYAALPIVEVGEHLRFAHEVVRMLATVEDIIVELLVVDVRQGE